MNLETLKDPNCLSEISAFIQYWPYEQPNFSDVASWWDEGKRRIKLIAIKHSVKRSRKHHQRTHKLQESIITLQQQPIPNINQINSLKRQLKDHLDLTFNGARIRSRANWTEQGEKPSKYFFGLEQHRQPKNTIRELRTNIGTVQSDIDILTAIQDFYENLYTSEVTDDDDQ